MEIYLFFNRLEYNGVDRDEQQNLAYGLDIKPVVLGGNLWTKSVLKNI